jgi:sugar lactone lactonase YvrE
LVDRNLGIIQKIEIANGTVTTVAGSAGTHLFQDSTDGTGATARFNRPSDITCDSTYLYVADTENNRIRRIDPITGETTTIAGSGNQGTTDGDGTAAEFNQPLGITTNGTSLYVTSADHTVRSVTLDGTYTVTTIAGSAGTSGSSDGTGTTARFNTPIGIVVYGGYLVVADTGNSIIRFITTGDGDASVTTIAGTAGTLGYQDGTGSSALFAEPMDISCDGTYIYVADTANHSIRRIGDLFDIVMGTAQVTTILNGTESGNGNGYLDGSTSSAKLMLPRSITNTSSALYVIDTWNSAVREIE